MEGMPAEALEPISIDVVLGGQTFVFREPVRRQARALMRRVLRMMARHDELIGEVQKQGDGEQPRDLATLSFDAMANAFDFTDDMQDCVYDALGVDAATRKTLDATASELEIQTAFQAIVEVIKRPFVGSPPAIQATKTPEEAPPPPS